MRMNIKFVYCDRQSPANNEAECAYLKVLMEKIVLSEMHTISTMTAIHLSTEASHQQSSQSGASTKKITKQRAEELLDEWVSSGYLLLLSENALITLGPKALAEFRDTLRTKFPDFIQNCHLCNDIVLKVCVCFTWNWNVKFYTAMWFKTLTSFASFFSLYTGGDLSKRRLWSCIASTLLQ